MDGKKFGKLSVIKTLYNYNESKKTYCECMCECGKTCIKDAYDLRIGKVVSCGCDSRKRSIEKNRKNYVGQRFGRLTVEKMIYENRPTKALCRCDCGNVITVIATQLPNGKTQSCGCLRRERITQANTKDFSNLMSDFGVQFIKQSHKNKCGAWLWECKCSQCENTFIALPAKVLNGHITSCGCIKSSGEFLVEKILKDEQIEYVPQKIFPDCQYVKPLRFDFYLPMYRTAIEYNGRQHYEPVEIFGGEKGFYDTTQRDAAKRSYCKENSIKLIEIPYTLSNNEICQRIQDIKNA